MNRAGNGAGDDDFAGQGVSLSWFCNGLFVDDG
jgi:hypothetical protein